MALLKFLAIAAMAFVVSACSNKLSSFDDIRDLFRPTTAGTPVRVVEGTPNVYQAQKQTSTQPKVTKQPTTKRINTTQCHDNDDWYLDGYRVGKSFRTQKAQMLQQRMAFCQFSSLPSQFRSSWERGFKVGTR